MRDRLERQKAEFEGRLQREQAIREDEFKRWQVIQETDRAIAVAEINANAKVEGSLAAAEEKANTDIAGNTSAPAKPKRKGPIDKLAEMHAEQLQLSREQGAQHFQVLSNLAKQIAAPRVLVRDHAGRAVRSESAPA